MRYSDVYGDTYANDGPNSVVNTAQGPIGCGAYRVELRPRGGGAPLAELKAFSLNYGRRVDDISAATVTIGAEGMSGEDCCATLGSLKAWQHEIAIWRDGVMVWAGPVLEPSWTDSGVTIVCRDLFQWFERRTMPIDRSFIATDLGTIFATYVSDALSLDTSPAIICVPTLTGILGDRSVTASQGARAADQLRELSRSGLDFSTIGRTVVIGGEEVPTASIGTLTTDHLLDAQVHQRGLEAASKVKVTGSAGVTASAGGVDATIGLVELSVSEATIKDGVSILAAAQSRLAMLNPPPEYLSGRLSSDAPFDFAQLVPGSRVDARVVVGCKSVLATIRLTSVDVQVQASEQGLSEAIGVTFIPLGSTQGP